MVREKGPKCECQSDVGKVDEDECSHRLETHRLTEVAAIHTVAARDVAHQPTERSGAEREREREE